MQPNCLFLFIYCPAYTYLVQIFQLFGRKFYLLFSLFQISYLINQSIRFKWNSKILDYSKFIFNIQSLNFFHHLPPPPPSPPSLRSVQPIAFKLSRYFILSQFTPGFLFSCLLTPGSLPAYPWVAACIPLGSCKEEGGGGILSCGGGGYGFRAWGI